MNVRIPEIVVPFRPITARCSNRILFARNTNQSPNIAAARLRMVSMGSNDWASSDWGLEIDTTINTASTMNQTSQITIGAWVNFAGDERALNI